MSYLSTSESVTSGHPDKLCDLISDSILDECLRLDPDARVAIEVFTKGLNPEGRDPPNSYIIIGGEVSIKDNLIVNYEKIARDVAVKIGYNSQEIGMDASDLDLCQVLTIVGTQSRDISQGVTKGEGLHQEQGAGDQGVMYGYATMESEDFDILKGSYMPLPILLSHRLTLGLTEARINGELNWARPDGKSQVTVSYNEAGTPTHIDSIIIAIQHDDLVKGEFFDNEDQERNYIIDEVTNKIIKKLMPKQLMKEDMKIIINGTGRFIIGGPEGDAGLTGRKIIVDTYGGVGRHGGGAFSGKDPSKVDRSGAYMARWVAKHIVASGLCKKCEIQISYAIGVAEPVNVNITINSFESSEYSNKKLEHLIRKVFDFRPNSITDRLKLKNPIYAGTTSGGHFGRIADDFGTFTWEKLDSKIIDKLINGV